MKLIDVPTGSRVAASNGMKGEVTGRRLDLVKVAWKKWTRRDASGRQWKMPAAEHYVAGHHEVRVV